MESIKFENKSYPIREIEIPEYGNVIISSTLLNSELMKEDGSYSCEKARKIDEQIFCFVEPEEINYSEYSLTKLIHQVI